MPPSLPIRRVVLYKHGVGYFERRGKVSGSSMTVLYLSGGSVPAVSYDSTKPLAKGSLRLRSFS